MVEWVKRGTLRWYGNILIMNENEFMRIHRSEVEGQNVRGNQYNG